jgi:hypothetical protein
MRSSGSSCGETWSGWPTFDEGGTAACGSVGGEEHPHAGVVVKVVEGKKSHEEEGTEKKARGGEMSGEKIR